MKEAEEVCAQEAKIDEEEREEEEDVFAPVPPEITQAKEVLDLVKSLHKLCEENMQLTSLTGRRTVY